MIVTIKNHRFVSLALVSIGFVLSPFTWWNDLIVNVPLAYVISLPFSLLHEELFLPGFIFGYWLTNLAGLLMLHIGGEGLIRGKHVKPDIKHGLIVSIAYTGVIIIIVMMGWLSPPTTFLEQFP